MPKPPLRDATGRPVFRRLRDADGRTLFINEASIDAIQEHVRPGAGKLGQSIVTVGGVNHLVSHDKPTEVEFHELVTEPEESDDGGTAPPTQTMVSRETGHHPPKK